MRPPPPPFLQLLQKDSSTRIYSTLLTLGFTTPPSKNCWCCYYERTCTMHKSNRTGFFFGKRQFFAQSILLRKTTYSTCLTTREFVCLRHTHRGQEVMYYLLYIL